MASFNLITENWIPCIMADGQSKEFGLKETIEKIDNIKEIFDPSPLITVSLHRLLLAILHRIFAGPKNSMEWVTLWDLGKNNWDVNKISNYFTKWHHRFNLFDEKWPFYQCASVPFYYIDPKTNKTHSYFVPVAKLFHELASGNNATLFDHTSETDFHEINPDEAARLLVAFQSFAVGGLITLEKGQDPKLFKSADNAPLVKGAVTMVQGKDLFQTLLLNFHHYSIRDEEPFAAEKDDVPAWEREDEVAAKDRKPKGYLDLLTWQSRRIRLCPAQNENGQTVVHTVVIMKGEQFPDDFTLHNKETMLAFSRIDKPKLGQPPWSPVSFREDKALWRDSLTLLQSVYEQSARPKVLDWLSDLASDGAIPLSNVYSLCLAGLRTNPTNPASIILWRHERLPLPLSYLDNEGLFIALNGALSAAEAAGKQIDNTSWYLSKLIITPNVENPNKEQLKEIRKFSDHLNVSWCYWSRLGIIFNKLVVELVQDKTIDNDDQIIYGAKVLPWWANEVRSAATTAFEQATNSLDQSARTLKAITQAEQPFKSRLSTIVKPYLNC